MMQPCDETDVPPAVKCAVCGEADCTGCIGKADLTAKDATLLPWESPHGTWHQRLWRTSIAASTLPARTFGELPDGNVGPALAFAIAAETVAIGSLGLVVSLAAFALSPELWLRLAATPAVVLGFFGLLTAAMLAMVGLHALWGICLELGAQTRNGAAKFRHGVRFGLYACGWDLLTSPAGVIEGVLSRGPRGALGPIADAVLVPRRAMLAYVETCRGFDALSRRRSERFSLLVLTGSMLALLAVAVAAVLWFAEQVG